MGEVSDKALFKRLTTLLETSDLAATFMGDIRRQLEAEMGADLSSHMILIQHTVEAFLQKQAQDNAPLSARLNHYKQLLKPLEFDAKSESKGKSPRMLPKRKRLAAGGLAKVCKLSEELAAVIGTSEASRTQVTSDLWKYIREHKLQVPSNMKKIRCDNVLRKVFGVDQVDMFGMQKTLQKHIDVVDSTGKARKEHRISSDLTEFRREVLGIRQAEASPEEVVKQIWMYIKASDLQDPSNRKVSTALVFLKRILEFDY